ncbi:MAG: 50S ribosomal protein L10 [bacterium]|nr:50S ribosomal protein L10 [bacterium]
MKSRVQKQEESAKLKDKLSKAKITIFSSFAGAGQEQRGLGVSAMEELKQSLRKADSEYVAAKKTIVGRVIDKGVDVSQFNGSLGLAFGYGDEVATAKEVYQFSRKNPALKLWGAMFGDDFIDGERLISLAKLPGREVLLGQMVGMVQYPLSGLVNVLQANIRNLVLVLANIKKQ